MHKINNKVEEIEFRVGNISQLRKEAEQLSQYRAKKPKKTAPIELYSRPWESIVIKVKK